MTKRTWIAAIALAAAVAATDSLPRPAHAPRTASAADAAPRYAVQDAWPGLKFEAPIDVACPPDASDRVFVAQRAGKILVLKKYRGSGAVTPPKTFLDLGPLLSARPQEEGHGGLLSIAFPPDFAKSQRLYVIYGTGTGTPQDPFRTVLASYGPSAGDPDLGDPASGQLILQVPKRGFIHFGGGLAFGKDGLLYVGIGDTGMTNDPDNVAQDPRTLEGKILRIDVNTPTPGKPYGIPTDNPWPSAQGVRPEIFAYGVRNPWRMSFDRETGLLWLGDPGQKQREEIDVVPHAGNLGWAKMEADLPLAVGANPSQFVAPVYAYGREFGSCVIGGVVYRGQRCLDLVGKYVFADFMFSKVLILPVQGARATGAPELLAEAREIASIDEDLQGELYLSSLDDGRVLTVVPSR